MDTNLLLSLTGNTLIIVGVLIFAVAAVGLFKFRDVYTRISAVGTAAGLGISVVVVGAFCLAPSWMNFAKLLLILVLQLATSSIGTMAIARAAYLTGSPMRPGHFDQLAEDQHQPEAAVSPDQDVSRQSTPQAAPQEDTDTRSHRQ